MTDVYSVVVYKSRMPLPAIFAFHTWIVVSKGNESDRFDLMGFIRNDRGIRNGHVYMNYHPPNLGCPVLALGWRTFFHNALSWSAVIVYEDSGGAGSIAERAYNFMHQNAQKYPYIEGPFGLVRGPNCNTFTQWVINGAQIPCNLPWGAFGKTAASPIERAN